MRENSVEKGVKLSEIVGFKLFGRDRVEKNDERVILNTDVQRKSETYTLS
jgi:hypothetical protein